MIRVFKYLISFFTTNWTFEHYPLLTWINENAGEPKVQFGAGFSGWHGLVGHGSTKKQAVAELRNHFEQFKLHNKLPRPGTSKPLEFATTDRIDAHEEIAVEFFKKILKMNYYDCFISDLSSLHDFGEDFGELEIKILENYGLTKNEIGEGFFVDIFDQIEKRSR